MRHSVFCMLLFNSREVRFEICELPGLACPCRTPCRSFTRAARALRRWICADARAGAAPRIRARVSRNTTRRVARGRTYGNDFTTLHSACEITESGFGLFSLRGKSKNAVDHKAGAKRRIPSLLYRLRTPYFQPAHPRHPEGAAAPTQEPVRHVRSLVI